MIIRFTRKPTKKIVKRRKKTVKLEWQTSSDVQELLRNTVEKLKFEHIPINRIFAYRTTGSKARAYARIWAFPKIFQQALGVEPAYVIEVLSEKFDRLGSEEKVKVIIHELLHIPKNFSGSLLPHSNGYKTIEREVERLYKEVENKK